jgi:hypothetical protein
MKGMLGFILLAAGAVALTPSCTRTDGDCTLIGCTSSVQADVTAVVSPHEASLPLSVEMCFDGSVCDTFAVESISGSVVLELSISGDTKAGDYPLDVTISDDMGTELAQESETVSITVTAPNGEDCGPVCAQGNVTVGQ